MQSDMSICEHDFDRLRSATPVGSHKQVAWVRLTTSLLAPIVDKALVSPASSLRRSDRSGPLENAPSGIIEAKQVLLLATDLGIGATPGGRVTKHAFYHLFPRRRVDQKTNGTNRHLGRKDASGKNHALCQRTPAAPPTRSMGHNLVMASSTLSY